jgi:single-stranded DNA-binding protein
MKRMIITGYASRDAEFRTDSTGKDFATFSVGVSVGSKDNPKTDWVDISCGGSLLGIAKYIKQGCKVFIEGFPSIGAYLNKENKPTATQKLFANYMEILTFKSEIANADTPNIDELSMIESTNQSDNNAN